MEVPHLLGRDPEEEALRSKDPGFASYLVSQFCCDSSLNVGLGTSSFSLSLPRVCNLIYALTCQTIHTPIITDTTQELLGLNV